VFSIFGIIIIFGRRRVHFGRGRGRAGGADLKIGMFVGLNIYNISSTFRYR